MCRGPTAHLCSIILFCWFVAAQRVKRYVSQLLAIASHDELHRFSVPLGVVNCPANAEMMPESGVVAAQALANILFRHTKKSDDEAGATHSAPYPFELTWSDGLSFEEVFCLPRVLSSSAQHKTHWHREFESLVQREAQSLQTKISSHIERITVARVNAANCSYGLSEPLEWNPSGAKCPFEAS